jgi:aminopeptidase N
VTKYDSSIDEKPRFLLSRCWRNRPLKQKQTIHSQTNNIQQQDMTQKHQLVRRAEYTPPGFQILNTQLWFTLESRSTTVRAALTILRDPNTEQKALVLNGEQLGLKQVKIDDRILADHEYSVTDQHLVIPNFPPKSVLETLCEIDPASNFAFTGLYLSNGNFFTQCEAEGFRRITYFADRPDVMSRFQVYMEAPQNDYPVLLSNGNLIDQGQVAHRPGWHWAQWDDPFPKPSYLFALVAGRFVVTEKSIASASGKPALLQVWVEPGNQDKTQHAMDSLVNAIRWDERRFGLELDLERFMIVASADFNMGAMENKGLNIFNTKYVFANPRIATDTDFEGVEAVVGHEYFHNWTGNRVTCRDWFQLTLKEGLTVFRDQEFSADLQAEQASNPAQAASARAVKRIDDVRVLRTSQFTEDAGPMAHSIRPDEYSEINNFYTVTVYEKGAEVIRMLQTLLGRTGFRKGMDLYFKRHDGQAVTCDDFVAAMADANSYDLGIFKRWYAQAGTPTLHVSWQYIEAKSASESATLEITFTQELPQNVGPGLPLLIPIVIGALDASGKDLLPENALYPLAERSATVSYKVGAKPVAISVLRDFSAPVLVKQNLDDLSLSFLAQHDSDPFNRWDAIQQLALQAVQSEYERLGVATASTPSLEKKAGPTSCLALIEALRIALADPTLDRAYLASLLALPSEGLIGEQIEALDPTLLRTARNTVHKSIAENLQAQLIKTYEASTSVGAYSAAPSEVGRRALRNICLSYLTQLSDMQLLAETQFSKADNMTDRWGAVTAIIHHQGTIRGKLLAAFEIEFRDEALVLDKWFSAQATSQVPSDPNHSIVLDTVISLMQRADFSLKNPNRARALVHSFCQLNPAQFHQANGSGYLFWERMVLELDEANPQVAARLARAMDRWKKFAPHLKSQMKQSLERVAAQENLSSDVREVITKALAT